MLPIERLTDAQKARAAEFRDRWMQIGLCTDPADRPRAEAAIRETYRQGGLEPPARIVWCGSPLSQGLTRSIMIVKKPIERLWESVGTNVRHYVGGGKSDANLRPSVSHSIWQSVGARVGDKIWATVRNSVWVGVADSAGAIVRDQVEDSVWDSVRASVGDSVWDSVEATAKDRVCVGARLRESVEASVYGSHDASWLAFYRYFHEVLGLTDQTGRLSGLWELAQSAGWALPHQNICWVSERHHILSRDDRGRLHCNTGPACGYPDGWTIYAVHGVRVPRYVIEEPAKIDVARIGAETNAEIRRVMIERYRHGENVSGSAAYVRDSGAKRLDHDERFGTLWRRDLPNDEPIVMIEVINSTPEPDGRFKRYWLRVPPDTKTAHEAVAWTFGVPAKDYAPAVET
jgi:uncharacterized protein DUF6745